MRLFRILSFLKVAAALLFAGACAENGVLARANAEDVLVVVSDTGEHRFVVELADDDEERRVGLMHRTELAENAGMLFDFEETQPVSMWMKNTLISLDMAFIDKDGVIRRIAAETTPRSLESISSGVPVIAVLEVNGGLFERLGVEEGDRVRHPMFDAE